MEVWGFDCSFKSSDGIHTNHIEGAFGNWKMWRTRRKHVGLNIPLWLQWNNLYWFRKNFCGEGMHAIVLLAIAALTRTVSESMFARYFQIFQPMR